VTERGSGVPPTELPSQLRPSRDRLVAPDVLLTDALAVLAAAGTRAEAASACLPLLAQRPGVRAAAVVVRSGRHAVVVGSTGYDCSSMAPGTELPLDAGLPVTEAVRTGRTVARGDGPGWIAVPFGRGSQEAGALLLSLTCAPPESAAGLALLSRLARAIGDALHRSAGAEEAVATLAAVSEALRSPAAQDERCDAVVRTLPVSGDVGGDVVICLPDGRGGTWLLAADVVGSGLVAALLARSVRAAARTAATWAAGPAALLDAVESGIRDDVPPGSFVTAAVVHLSGDRLRAASAGHPAPLLLRDGVSSAVPLEPGAPLALETDAAETRPEVAVDVAPDVTVLLHTDGLVERRCGEHVRLLDPVALAGGLPHELEAAADALLAAADAFGPARDDVSLLLARARR
jgi:hypothetical protein